ncbi:MAG TPA: addiction module protein [Kofleriaceae bacterium]|nr:addiction module protein [Kofleriaceae bacterium]
MPIPDLDSLLNLDIETRLGVVQRLWASIVEDTRGGATLALRSKERELLDARLKEDDDDPDAAIRWAEARNALLGER